jgi:hypothetical protein
MPPPVDPKASSEGGGLEILPGGAGRRRREEGCVPLDGEGIEGLRLENL